MSKEFRIGDKVKVVGMSPVTFAPRVKDELGTEKLFKSMLGKVYTVRGFDKYGNVELEPKYSTRSATERTLEAPRPRQEIAHIHLCGSPTQTDRSGRCEPRLPEQGLSHSFAVTRFP
jgi:hypothetical protein